MSESTTSALLSVASGVATTVVEAANPGLLTKAQSVVSSVEHDAETFFAHNVALQPLAQSIVSLAVSQGEQHVPMLMTFLEGLLPLFAQASAHTVTVPPAS